MNEEQATSPSYCFVIAAFDDENAAPGALASVLAARRERKLAVPAAASIRKDQAGVLDINEPGDVGAKEGAVAGALLGGLLGGLLGRRPVRGAAFGAALGALGASKHDAGIPNTRLAEIGAGLPTGSSALAAIVPEGALADLQALLENAGGRMTVEPMAVDFDVARQFSEGAYGDALDSLATQAESLIAEAEERVAQAAGAASQKTEVTPKEAELPQPAAGEAPEGTDTATEGWKDAGADV
jgi:uncharacterized membrane protein